MFSYNRKIWSFYKNFSATHILKHKCFQDILSKMVCQDPSRDCYMSMCDHCKPLAIALKDEVIKVFNELEIEEVRIDFVLMSSTLLASKVRCSISVLENSSTSVVLQSQTPLRVPGVRHPLTEGMLGGAATSTEGVPGDGAPSTRGGGGGGSGQCCTLYRAVARGCCTLC